MTTETKTKLPKFQGKPLIETPDVVSSANFLEGDFGKVVHNEVVAEYGPDNPFVTSDVSYNDEDNVVRGSKPGYAVAVNKVLREDERILRTATPADLERISRVKALPLRGQYEDSALVLRSEDEPNKYLAKNLIKQVKARNPKAKMPVMIPLCGLELVKDSDSPHNSLSFKLREDAEIIYAHILNKDSACFVSEDIDKKTGLPTKLGKEGRYFCTINSGLSRLVLGRGLVLDSYWGDLAYSVGYGRVVVVSAEGASQK